MYHVNYAVDESFNTCPTYLFQYLYMNKTQHTVHIADLIVYAYLLFTTCNILSCSVNIVFVSIL